MRKIIYLVMALILCTIFVQAQEVLQLRDYDGVELPAGTFIQVFNVEEFSTRYCDDTKKLKFLTTNDTFIFQTKVIPTGTEIQGYIEKINEPVVGTNASMVIRINKMVFKDGFEVPLRGYIYTANGNLIGGELTPPKKYVKVPHYQHGYRGALQWRPSAERQMGQHLTIAAGADLVVVLVSPAWITHTLTN